MNLQPSFTFGICLCVALILIGGASYSYSTQVTYPVQTPVTTYVDEPVLRSYYVLVYEDNISDFIDPADTIYFGPYDAVANPFNQIAFNILETDWATYLIIEGVANGVVWWNISKNHGMKYISVWSNDTYLIKIENLNPNQPVFVRGRIEALRTEYYTEMVPVPYTTYETTYLNRTEYHYRQWGVMFLILGAFAGIGMGAVLFQNKRRMREVEMGQ